MSSGGFVADQDPFEFKDVAPPEPSLRVYAPGEDPILLGLQNRHAGLSEEELLERAEERRQEQAEKDKLWLRRYRLRMAAVIIVGADGNLLALWMAGANQPAMTISGLLGGFLAWLIIWKGCSAVLSLPVYALGSVFSLYLLQFGTGHWLHAFPSPIASFATIPVYGIVGYALGYLSDWVDSR